MSGYVLDASVVAAWLLPGQASPRSEALLTEAFRLEFRSPRFFLYELHRIVLKAERGGVFAADAADEALAEILTYAITIEPEPTEDHLARVHALAREERLSFYDALYLDVALAAQLPIASGDKALLEAAHRSNLDVYDVRNAL